MEVIDDWRFNDCIDDLIDAKNEDVDDWRVMSWLDVLNMLRSLEVNEFRDNDCEMSEKVVLR